MSSMIVAPQPAAVEAGAQALMAGGNAVDAAVTAAFAQMIVSPQMCGIGGYVLLNLHLADANRRPASLHSPSIGLDAPALAGSKTRPDMWVSEFLRANPDGWGFFLKGRVNDIGYTSICTPGTVKALSAILERWGTISWAQAIEPAARLADDGFMVDAAMAAEWRTKSKYPGEEASLLERIEANPEAQRIYLKPDGSAYDAGDTIHNPDYARTLRHLARHGADDFYHGELADRMLADLEANGSFVTRDDLANYRFRDVEPAITTYRGYTVTSAQAPHGGPTLLEILNILEGYDLSQMQHNSPDYIYLVSMAMKAAFADRNRYVADMQFVDVPMDMLLSKARAAAWRKVIDAGQPIDPGNPIPEAPHTTHVSVVDKDGNCVALTHSLGSSSGVITPGLGFMWNDSMVNYHPLPGHANSIAPGKSRTTGMSPTIIYDRTNKPVLVLGAPGATRIITSCLQVVLNVLDFGMSVSDAVLAPRFDCQVNYIRCHARIPEFVCAEVRKKHPIQRIPQSHGGFALVHAITIDPKTGKLAGAADTGSGGMAWAV